MPMVKKSMVFQEPELLEAWRSKHNALKEKMHIR